MSCLRCLKPITNLSPDPTLCRPCWSAIINGTANILDDFLGHTILFGTEFGVEPKGIFSSQLCKECSGLAIAPHTLCEACRKKTNNSLMGFVLESDAPLTLEKLQEIAEAMPLINASNMFTNPHTPPDVNCRCIDPFGEQLGPSCRCIECARRYTTSNHGRCIDCHLATMNIDGTYPIESSRWMTGLDTALTEHFGVTPFPYPHHT